MQALTRRFFSSSRLIFSFLLDYNIFRGLCSSCHSFILVMYHHIVL
jgi:hypothetical protein